MFTIDLTDTVTAGCAKGETARNDLSREKKQLCKKSIYSIT